MILILTATVPPAAPAALGYSPSEAAAFGWHTLVPLIVFVMFLSTFLLGLGLLRRI